MVIEKSRNLSSTFNRKDISAMEAKLLKEIPDTEFDKAMDAANRGDYGPVLEHLGFKLPAEGGMTPDLKKSLLSAVGKLYPENRRFKFRLDELLVQEVFNSVPDPQFDTSGEPTGGNTKNHDWPIVLEDHVEEMDDCTFETIRAGLGFMFNSKSSENRESIRGRVRNIQSYLRPTVEAEIQHVAQAYSLPIIESCVRAGCESLPEGKGIPEGSSLVMKGIEGLMKPGSGTALELDNDVYENAKRMGIPDWSIYLLFKSEGKRYVTLGETKMDSKWTSSWLPKKLGRKFTNNEAQWPLRQQAKYCLDGNTSWSFLYTPKEVVVSRFYIVPRDNRTAGKCQTPVFGLLWKAIPMREDISFGELGSSMAIWAWIMFAFLDQNRGLRTRIELCKLTEIVPNFHSEQSTGHEEILGEALKVADEGFVAIEESEIVKVVTTLKESRPTKKPRKGLKLGPTKSVWEGRLRSRKGNVVIGVGLP